jgi:type I restriction enzyme S subunit
MAGDEWKEVCLEDVAEEVTVGHVGLMASEYVADGVPFLRSQNVEPLRVNDADLKFITPAFHQRLRKSALAPGDVVIVRTGAPGTCAVIPSSLPIANCSDLVIVRCGPELDPRFLAYYVNSVAAHHVDSHLVGAVQQHFNVGSARKMLMHLPTAHEQRAIAQILGTLDDKIELNRRMNETLESIALALFKSWFVDFNPVRAKAKGRASDLPTPLADLFPASFEDSELGQIPKGWEAGAVDDTFNLTMGQSPPGETYNEIGEGLPFFQGRADFTFRFPTHRVYCTAPTRLAKAGDTLVSVRAPVGDINLAAEDCAIGRGVAAVRHKTGGRSFTYYSMRSLEKDFAKFEAEGTVFGSINKKDFHNLACIIPGPRVVSVFEKLAGRLDDRIERSEREASTLAALRDTLLPKLISGEVRVKDAERVFRVRA